MSTKKSVRTHNPERQAKELQTGVQAIKTASLTSSLDLRVRYVAMLASSNNVQLFSKIITKKMYAEALLAWVGIFSFVFCVVSNSLACLFSIRRIQAPRFASLVFSLDPLNV
jgi:hypothetical protein